MKPRFEVRYRPIARYRAVGGTEYSLCRRESRWNGGKWRPDEMDWQVHCDGPDPHCPGYTAMRHLWSGRVDEATARQRWWSLAMSHNAGGANVTAR